MGEVFDSSSKEIGITLSGSFYSVLAVTSYLTSPVKVSSYLISLATGSACLSSAAKVSSSYGYSGFNGFISL